MNMAVHLHRQGELGRQAMVARNLGSPFVAAVLEAGERQLHRAPMTARLIAGWPQSPSAAALAMRFNAALHALARREILPVLTALYKGEHDEFDHAIGRALATQDGFIATWMRDTPQTNEVGRAAAICAALMAVQRNMGLPFELLELGSSCGLNLNLARYAYELGGLGAGVAGSPVRIAPVWRGERPVIAPFEVVAARGVDLNPLDAGDAMTRERLLAYVWADQPARARRLEQALELARRHPPLVDRGEALPWIVRQLEVPQQAGRCRTVFHSMVLQYLSDHDRRAVIGAIRAAGERATVEKPLAWISFEWTSLRDEVQLILTCWPDGERRILATCHAYGNWIDWQG